MQKHLDIIKPKLPGSHRPRFSKKQKAITAIVLVLVVAVIIALFVWLKYVNSSAAYIQHDKYQAVFMTNNQVYFGKLQKLGDGSYRLTDVFYVKNSSAPTSGSTAQSTPQQSADQSQKPQLVKLGSEIHAPVDEIMIPPQNLLFWENIKSDGTVVKSIDQYKKNNQ